MRITVGLLVSSLCLVSVSAGVAGCHHQSPAVAPSMPPPPTVAPAPPPPPPPVAPVDSPAPRPLTEDEAFAQRSLDEVNEARPLEDVFFDYDRATLRPDGRDRLAKNAAWLQRWTTTKITVSGHCDERGTAEYNLALGDRRAVAVKSYLVSLGIAGDRIATVSYGEERPFCAENVESCWSQNRRARFVVTEK